jgi:hypothetical protein
MTRRTSYLLLGVAALVLTASLTLSLRAQPQAKDDPKAEAVDVSGPARSSVQDALTRPFSFTFAKPTSLEHVAAHLSKELNAPVALDRAALDRLDVRPDDTVQLELKGVRLKTGLKLLLDQLDLTYRVEPEDNLLVITDTTGTSDPMDHVRNELKSIHRDLHDVQDAVDDIRNAMGIGKEGDRLRKPTIIEEVPPGGTPKPKDPPPATTPSPSRSRPGA